MSTIVYAQQQAQTIFVDPVSGSDTNSGTSIAPLKSLKHAVSLANGNDIAGTFTIKLLPGLYVLEDKVQLERKTAGLVIEASDLPDSKDWNPYKMPVISSVSANNSTVQFPHAAGILVAMNNVKISGLKFIGNANPVTRYYYPISRKDTLATGLEISQCYFIGERNAAPIQAAVWVHGSKLMVDHCVFFECKNALVLIENIRDFSMTNSIVYGAYEAAVWFGAYHTPVRFSNNVISNCNFFWLRAEGTYPKYEFQNSLFAGNQSFMGHYTKSGLKPAGRNEHIEKNVQKNTKKVELITVGQKGLITNYLHLSNGTMGSELKAGIFK
ncbi:right-handed parallel beta-helix repeat-containing protein [Sphingobacterium detergens]|uniref:Parallel beta helix pectate lyase-like protein n=1 Tax=Sphingobacterium detergens TaxID=1145106 RepID=A0A420BFE7_SPHD1|nr:right-handed parallel beta-helix repeat-containing protein [Sphingobacterium detergens]RKE55441.1 parallel beta helix pectate lyase-like protein [Sphingobacterium detergens]